MIYHLIHPKSWYWQHIPAILKALERGETEYVISSGSVNQKSVLVRTSKNTGEYSDRVDISFEEVE